MKGKYGFIKIETGGILGEREASLILSDTEAERNATAFKDYCEAYDICVECEEIDRDFTKRRLSKSEFEKRFSGSGVVTIQCFESHIQYETVNL